MSVERTMSIGGVDLSELQSAHRQHPELSAWRSVSQIVIRDYVEANSALAQQLREAAQRETVLEEHIATVESQNEQLVSELAPEPVPQDAPLEGPEVASEMARSGT